VYSYVALVWDPRDADAGRTVRAFSNLIAGSDGWNTAYQGQGLVVAYKASHQGSARAYVLPAGSGVILGTLFPRGASDSPCRATTAVVERDSEGIVGSGGQFLVDQYWGAYVAFLYDARSRTHHVFREPLGNLPCYRTGYGNVHCFFSDVTDALRFTPVRFSMERDYLIRWLVVGRLIARDCGLADVEDMTGGERVSFHLGQVRRTFLWNPVRIATDDTIEDVNDAADQLRVAVQGSVNAWTSCYRRVTHKLSGGLDSSIVAGCLAQAPTKPALSFLHFSINEGVENEQWRTSRFICLALSTERLRRHVQSLRAVTSAVSHALLPIAGGSLWRSRSALFRSICRECG
jgi:asparagine synthase (glutamine-hydrolysing)